MLDYAPNLFGRKKLIIPVYLKWLPWLPRAKAENKISLPDNYNSSGPSAKIKILAEPEIPPNRLKGFRKSEIPLSWTSQCEGSLSSAAVGIQCYSAFCDLMGYQYFPPSSANVRRWGSILTPGKLPDSIVATCLKRAKF